jgi:hypothetical protein
MKVDNNETMLESMRIEKSGDQKKGWELRDQFIAELRAFKGDHCSCTEDCIYHGRCKECVAIHRGHRDHLPNCLKGIQNK